MSDVLLPILILVGTGAVLLAVVNYTILRTRPADLEAIRAYLAAQNAEEVSRRRGLRQLGERPEGESFFGFHGPSRSARVYVLVVRAANGQLSRWRVAFDPWQKARGMIILSRHPL